jgi:nucleoside-diphosphate-sugar epimerase
MKKVLILGGGGFIGGHLGKRLKEEGHHVRICDIKKHEYFKHSEICHEFIVGDLRDPKVVDLVIEEGIDEVYQLAADMGGAGYIFTGEHDADVMHNSALINLNVAHESVKKNVGKVFYSSSACMYPEHNQLDPENPNCVESSAYPANPDSEYGWEKLFSERVFLAMCRKASESPNGGSLEVWGDGLQTRSFLYVDECVEAVLRLMDSDFTGPVNIGSEEMVTINELAQMAIDISGKDIKIDNISGNRFFDKYGHKCPVGVRGRNSDNKLYKDMIGWEVSQPLRIGMEKTYKWINKMNNNG